MTTSVSQSDTRQNRLGPENLGFTMAVIALLAAIFAMGFAYFVDMTRSQRFAGPQLDTQGAIIEKSIAGQRLAIPEGWFRFTEQKAPGFSEKIDLVFSLRLGAAREPRMVEVSLVPRSRARPSDRLLDSVYLHQFTNAQAQGPNGLIGKPLKSQDGFQNETVWYDAVSVDPFVAKCMPLADKPEKETCMRTVRVTDQVAAVYVFDKELLSNWKLFDSEAQLWLKRIGGI